MEAIHQPTQCVAIVLITAKVYSTPRNETLTGCCMKKPLKITLWILAVVVVLLIITPIILVKMVDPNQFKPRIEKMMYEKTGRILKISGSLSWHFFPHIGISTGSITLENPPGYGGKTFISVESADVSVALWPLLSRHINVQNLSLSGLKLHLIKKSATQNNWYFSHEPSSAAQPNSATITPSAKHSAVSLKQPAVQQTNTQQPVATPSKKHTAYIFDIRNVTIKNAMISFEDWQNKQHYELQKINLQAQNIEPSKPFHLRVRFLVEGKQPPLSLDVTLTTTLNINLIQQYYQFDQLNLYTSMSLGNEVTQLIKLNSHVTGTLMLDLKQGQLQTTFDTVLNNLLNINSKLVISDLMESPQYKGNAVVKSFDLNQFFRSMGLATPDIPNPDALSNVSGQFEFSGDSHDVDVQLINAVVNDIVSNGHLTVQQFTAPHVTLNLKSNGLEVADFVPLQGALLPVKGISLSTDLTMQGVDAKHFPSTLNGTIIGHANSVILQGIDLSAILNKIDNMLSNFHRGYDILKMMGELKQLVPTGGINLANGQTTTFGQMDLQANIKNGIAQVQKANLHSPSIVVNGSGHVNLNQQLMRMDFNIFSPDTQAKEADRGRAVISIPVFIHGSFHQLNYGIDWQSLQNQLLGALARSTVQGLQTGTATSSGDVGELVRGIFTR